MQLNDFIDKYFSAESYLEFTQLMDKQIHFTECESSKIERVVLKLFDYIMVHKKQFDSLVGEIVSTHFHFSDMMKNIKSASGDKWTALREDLWMDLDTIQTMGSFPGYDLRKYAGSFFVGARVQQKNELQETIAVCHKISKKLKWIEDYLQRYAEIGAVGMCLQNAGMKLVELKEMLSAGVTAQDKSLVSKMVAALEKSSGVINGYTGHYVTMEMELPYLNTQMDIVIQEVPREDDGINLLLLNKMMVGREKFLEKALARQQRLALVSDESVGVKPVTR